MTMPLWRVFGGSLSKELVYHRKYRSKKRGDGRYKRVYRDIL